MGTARILSPNENACSPAWTTYRVSRRRSDRADLMDGVVRGAPSTRRPRTSVQTPRRSISGRERGPAWPRTGEALPKGPGCRAGEYPVQGRSGRILAATRRSARRSGRETIPEALPGPKAVPRARYPPHLSEIPRDGNTGWQPPQPGRNLPDNETPECPLLPESKYQFDINWHLI